MVGRGRGLSCGGCSSPGSRTPLAGISLPCAHRPGWLWPQQPWDSALNPGCALGLPGPGARGWGRPWPRCPLFMTLETSRALFPFTPLGADGKSLSYTQDRVFPADGTPPPAKPVPTAHSSCRGGGGGERTLFFLPGPERTWRCRSGRALLASRGRAAQAAVPGLPPAPPHTSPSPPPPGDAKVKPGLGEHPYLGRQGGRAGGAGCSLVPPAMPVSCRQPQQPVSRLRRWSSSSEALKAGLSSELAEGGHERGQYRPETSSSRQNRR